MAASMLNSDQLRQIRRLKSGYGSTAGSEWNGALGNVVSDLPAILAQTAAGLATGGVPGAFINGIGGLVNSGISGFGKAQDRKRQELESLYASLQSAEAQNKQRMYNNYMRY